MAVPAWFDVNVYLANKLAQLQKANPSANWTSASLASALTAAGFLGTDGAYDHFVKFGASENLSPNSLFSPDEYFQAKAAQFYKKAATSVTDLEVSTVKQLIANAGLNAWTHYVRFGSAEGVNPSNSFDESNYLAAKLAALKVADPTNWGTKTEADVSAAFKAAGYSALTHFLTFKGTGTAEVAATATFTVPDAEKVTPTTPTTTGQTFTLTTGLDTVAGTSGNDLIRGDFTATATVNAGDAIDGGAGTDTLQLFGNYAAANMPLSIKNVEILQFSSSQPDSAVDLTTFSKAATGIEKVVFDNVASLSGKTITTTAGQQVSLATGPSSVATTGAVTWAASATDATATLTLAGYQGGTSVIPAALTVTGAATKTTDLKSTVSKNGVSTLTLAATTETVNIAAATELSITTGLVAVAAKQVNVTGAGKVTIAGASTDLAATVTVDGSANTGGVNFRDEAAGSTLTFKGGAGNDSVTFAATRLTTADKLDGGAGTDTLTVNDTALTDYYGAINAATNFEVLGFATGGATVNVASLTSINSIANQSTGNLTINNSKNTTTVTIDNAGGSGTNAINNATGENTASVTVDFGSATTAQTVAAVNLAGATTVNLVSTGTGTGGSNIITALGNMDNSNIVLTGAKDLTIANALAGAGTGSKFDANAFTGKLSVLGSGQNDVIIGGSGADKLRGGNGDDNITGGAGNDLILGGAGADTLKGDAGNDTFVYVAKADSVTTANVDKITDFVAGTDKIGLNASGAASALLQGVTLTAGTAAMAAMGAMLQNATSVASVADVYTQLAITLDATALALSAVDGTATVARVVEFTTGAAAGKYLVINDSTAAFQAANDIVINLTGVSGTISATDFAFANDFFA